MPPAKLRVQVSRDALLARANYRPAADVDETLLARIWADALAVDHVGLDDDFFDLGGDSMAASDIMAGVQKEFGLDVATHALIEAPTVALLLSELRKQLATMSASVAETGRILLPLRTAGHLSPIILVPPRDDSAMRFRALANQLHMSHPVYAVIHQSSSEFSTMVAEELRQIVSIVGQRRVHLVGVCWGSLVALEMANQLVEFGIQPASTILLDPPPLLSRVDRINSRLRQRMLPWLTLVVRRLATYRAELTGLPRGRKLAFVVEKLSAAAKRLSLFSRREDLVEELVGTPGYRALTGIALAHAPRRPLAPVHLILTKDRPDGASRRARSRWISFLDAGGAVSLVPGRATGDVLLNHLPEFAEVIQQIVTESPGTGTSSPDEASTALVSHL
jgi:thioesterase domain-containing protein/acyl carrier protein